MANPANVELRRNLDDGGRKIGVRIEPRILRGGGYSSHVDDAVRRSIDGVLVISDAFFFKHREALFHGAIERRLPTIVGSDGLAPAGALLAYALDFPAIARRSGYYVSKILRGADPATLPIEQLTVLRMVVNMKTAKLIGVTIPPLMLARADEVIE